MSLFMVGVFFCGKYNQKTPAINKPIDRIYQERFDKLMMQHGLAERARSKFIPS